MAYNTKGPEDEILNAYYGFWKLGYNAERIYSNIVRQFPDKNLTPQKLHNYEPWFFNYVETRKKEELAEGIFVMEKTPELEANFLKYIRNGMAVDRAAKLLHIPMSTLMQEWYKDVDFKLQVDYACEIQVAKMEESLFKSGLGYERTVVTTTTTETELCDKDGKPTGTSKVTSTTEKVEHTPGKVRAQEVFLYNRAPDRWSPDGVVNKEGNKGTILEELENRTTLTEEDKAILEAREQKRIL